MNVWRYGMVYEGSYQVDGSIIIIELGGRTMSGVISNLSPDGMELEIESGDYVEDLGYYLNYGYYLNCHRREESFPVCTWTNFGPTISVTGNTWFVLDHQYSPGEEIHLENVTFGLYNAVDWDTGEAQALLGCCLANGWGVNISQRALLPNLFGDRSVVCFFNELTCDDEEGLSSYEYATSNGYILYNTDIVFSKELLCLNGNDIRSTRYSSHSFGNNINYCLFARDELGIGVVQNQTASLGRITFTKDGDVTAKYTPMLDDNGTPCFYNSVSGAYIYHSGSGTPIYHPGF